MRKYVEHSGLCRNYLEWFLLCPIVHCQMQSFPGAHHEESTHKKCYLSHQLLPFAVDIECNKNDFSSNDICHSHMLP